jgi:phospholipid/cholesterol/gamma-HCH transport system substrate-binding protein
MTRILTRWREWRARRRVRRRSWRERNPLVIGATGLAVLAGLVLVAFRVDDLPLVGGGDMYHAAFRDASGLAPGNEVRVAGVKIGTVKAVRLARHGDQPYVRVDFRVRDVALGDRTGATIRIKTVLGQKYLSLEPAGAGHLAEGAEIPLERTASPFDVVEAVNGLADTIGRIDTNQLARSFEVLAATFADTPESVKSALNGLARLSTTVASRDERLRALLAHARTVTAVLAQRDEEFRALIADANLLLAEVQRRRDAIHELLVSTQELATQISGLVADNRARLGPALRELRDVVRILQRNRGDLEQAVSSVSPFITAFTNVIGSGRWFDSWVDGLLQPYLPAGG